MYAILDIETTGGQFNEEGITEIAIYRFDGYQVLDQFSSLVNPEKPIQPYVVKLTGISNQMLHTAPKFYEVAKRIVEITTDCIIVAHNALFDYRILRTEFKRLGFDFNAKTLCTVELAQKLIPGQPAYSLGKLVRSLGIPVADRHRASGDALATLKLFKLLLDKDNEKSILKSLIKTEIEKGIAPRLTDLLEKLPYAQGVYYIYGVNGNLLYLSKSKNIKKSVNQHFTGSSALSKKITAQVSSISHEVTGSELVAGFKEHLEVVANQPAFNRAIKSKKRRNLFITAKEDDLGYLALTIERSAHRNKKGLFASMAEAMLCLTKITKDYQLCKAINGLSNGTCSGNLPSGCQGACQGEEPIVSYNKRVTEVLNKIHLPYSTFAMIDKGRHIAEKTAVLVEEGQVLGYAFIDLNYQVMQIEVLKKIMVALPLNREWFIDVHAYILKNKRVKVISLQA